MLLNEQSEYFDAHPRAHAFRWYLMGLLAMKLGDRRFARRAFLRSLRLRPAAKRLGHLALALRPSTFSIDQASDIVDVQHNERWSSH
jgi:hypothetical protein